MKSYLHAELSATALRENVAALRTLLDPATALCPVVKDDAYGHGMIEVFEALKDRTDGFAVASPGEALALRAAGWGGFLLCFLSAYLDDVEVRETLVREEVTQTVMSEEALRAIEAAAARVGKPARVHLKIDTGMGRLGIRPERTAAMLEAIRRAPHVTPTGIYTHFAKADEPDDPATTEQFERFRALLPHAGGLIRHAANSSALLAFPETRLDMVRPGIAVYGLHASPALHGRIDLTPCLRVTAKLIAVKHLPKGSRSGYGLTHRYERDSRVGVVPVGYGDGYFRAFSGRSIMCVRGRPAPVCGRISMDQTTIDLTDVPDAVPGDEVEVLSAESGAPNGIENLARLADTIPYEIACRLGRAISRRIVV